MRIIDVFFTVYNFANTEKITKNLLVVSRFLVDVCENKLFFLLTTIPCDGVSNNIKFKCRYSRNLSFLNQYYKTILNKEIS